ncbi:MAG: tRNA preQ1(34) S-adenosylmethionine ribosyltransferase-isomerase QueA [Opitutaceae bacterium]
MPPLSTDLFDFSLPDELIAQTPAARRDASRLLVVDRATRALSPRTFSDLPSLLRAGDALFRNNAAVLPARLSATRASGGKVECLLLRPTSEPEVWWCLLRPGKRLPVGARFGQSDHFEAEVLEKDAEGAARVVFRVAGQRSVIALANEVGDVPLPPYISRNDPAAARSADLARYQTVYARTDRQVAVAAPTAGLHFTPELLGQLATLGVVTHDVTLHVGLGTFKPISTETVEDHSIHREVYEVPFSTQQAIFEHQPPRSRRIAVGTTSVRAIEAFLREHGAPRPDGQSHLGEASLYLFPPATFRGVDGLITNFHQPRSTLLCLVSSFLTPGSEDGIAWLKEIYAEAIAARYRFFSYGDAMLIL